MRKITLKPAAIALAAMMAALAPTGATAQTTTCTLTELKGDWFMDYSLGARRFSGQCKYTCENGHVVYRFQLGGLSGRPGRPGGGRFSDPNACNLIKTIVVGPGEYDR